MAYVGLAFQFAGIPKLGCFSIAIYYCACLLFILQSIKKQEKNRDYHRVVHFKKNRAVIFLCGNEFSNKIKTRGMDTWNRLADLRGRGWGRTRRN